MKLFSAVLKMRMIQIKNCFGCVVLLLGNLSMMQYRRYNFRTAFKAIAVLKCVQDFYFLILRPGSNLLN